MEEKKGLPIEHICYQMKDDMYKAKKLLADATKGNKTKQEIKAKIGEALELLEKVDAQIGDGSKFPWEMQSDEVRCTILENCKGVRGNLDAAMYALIQCHKIEDETILNHMNTASMEMLKIKKKTVG